MREGKGIIDGIPVKLYIPEDTTEYSEGIRLKGGRLEEEEGLLFNFGVPQTLAFENKGVAQDITILFFHTLVQASIGVVSESANMKANSPTPVKSYNPASIALELTTEFCRRNKIKQGSMFTLIEIEDE